MRRFSRLMALFLVLPWLAACDAVVASGPDDDEITTAVIERFRSDPYARVGHVENVTKTNSVKNGTDEVVVMVRYDLVFDRSISEFADDVTQQGKQAGDLDALGNVMGDAVEVMKMKMLALKEGGFTVGDRRSISNEIRLVKSEQGWIYRP
ncbi:MAG: hypothetical protein ABID63_16465 [Pseudomonadota bacterium]